MPDDITQPAAPSPGPAVVPTPAAAPSEAAAPADSPAVGSPAPQTAEPTAAAPAADAPQAAATPEPAASILSDAKATEPKTETPAEAPKPEAPVVLPTYDAFTMPEGVALDEGSLGNFTKLLGEFEGKSGAPHDAVQAMGQQLVDFYLNEQQSNAAKAQQTQIDTWNALREQWKEEFKSDPDIGGNRTETTIRQAGAVLERYGNAVGADREAALRMAFRMTGMGDHPEMIRFIQWASKYTTEQAKPVPAAVPKAPDVRSRSQRRYAGSNS